MDCYFESGTDDLVVPTGQEFSDRLLSSPKIMSKWGMYAPDGFTSPNKYFCMDTNSMDEDFNFNGFCKEVDTEASAQNKNHSLGSSICAGSYEESLQSAALSSNQPDYQLDHFPGIEQLDDIFLNSLLEDLPSPEDLNNSIGFDPESQHELHYDNLITDTSLDSRSNSRETHNSGCSKYLKTRAFSPSVGWEYKEDVASTFSSCNSEDKFQQVKARSAEIQVPSEQNVANELVGEEISLEESVLQELRIVMTQMTEKTRICFRDALYRLSENSKQHIETLRQNGDSPAEISPESGHDRSMRSMKEQAVESETNVIDRAVADLLFNKMDLNVRDFRVMGSTNPQQEVIEETGSPKYSCNQPPTHQFHHDMFIGDANVPTFDQKQLAGSAKSSKDFSIDTAENNM